jgi:hypothetical protein
MLGHDGFTSHVDGVATAASRGSDRGRLTDLLVRVYREHSLS